MEIKLTPKPFTGYDTWISKILGVILVPSESDIEPLFQALCEQDDYWESYRNLIKVAPKSVSYVTDLVEMCEYVGKTDIYDVPALQEQFDFMIYQCDMGH